MGDVSYNLVNQVPATCSFRPPPCIVPSTGGRGVM
uniref:Uncharacterized protein n=1 Tax=Arundo donax TaxID=35708 RepID=A0A0A9A7V2_ARUDO